MFDRESVAVAFMFGVGSRYETPAQAGISHLIEHMVFKGGERYRTSELISQAIEGVGGVINAATDKEMTVFWAKVPKEKFDLAVGVLSDILFSATMLAEELEKERRVIIEELKMYQDNPQDYVQMVFDQAMFPDHPMGWDIAGKVETVSKLSRDDCFEYLRAQYLGKSLVVSVAGNVDPKHAQETIAATIAPWGNGAQPTYVPADLGKRNRKAAIVERAHEQANVLLGFPGVSISDPERHAATLLNGIVGDGMSSRLFMEVRERRALVYDIHSYVQRNLDCGIFGVYLGCDPKSAAEACEVVMDELHRIPTEGITEEELTRTKEYTKGRLLLGLEGTNSMCSFLGEQLLLTGEILTAQEIARQLDAVTSDEVVALAKRLLAEPPVLAAVGTFPDESKLAAAVA